MNNDLSLKDPTKFAISKELDKKLVIPYLQTTYPGRACPILYSLGREYEDKLGIDINVEQQICQVDNVRRFVSLRYDTKYIYNTCDANSQRWFRWATDVDMEKLTTHRIIICKNHAFSLHYEKVNEWLYSKGRSYFYNYVKGIAHIPYDQVVNKSQFEYVSFDNMMEQYDIKIQPLIDAKCKQLHDPRNLRLADI